jgi:hypothetical protein
LPWFPFRRKVIEAISRAALTLLLAAAPARHVGAVARRAGRADHCAEQIKSLLATVQAKIDRLTP